MKLFRLLRVIAVLGAYGALAAVLYKRAQSAGLVGATTQPATVATPVTATKPSTNPVGPVDNELIGV